jgi:chorismate mutase-like protein
MTPQEALDKLAQCREEIDAIDLRILELLNERATIVDVIGLVKRTMAMPIYEPKREDEVFRNVSVGNRGPLSQAAVKRLFERVIDEMRTLQRERMEEESSK